MAIIYYIGTKDKDTKDYQLTDEFINQVIINEFSKEYPLGFTITTGTGYYKHDSGDVVTEKTFIVTVLDISFVNRNLINILKEKLNQECIAAQDVKDRVMFI